MALKILGLVNAGTDEFSHCAVSLNFILSSASSPGLTYALSQADVVILGHQLLLVIVVHDPNEITGGRLLLFPHSSDKRLEMESYWASL